jgi:hypothetical protein
MRRSILRFSMVILVRLRYHSRSQHEGKREPAGNLSGDSNPFHRHMKIVKREQRRLYQSHPKQSHDKIRTHLPTRCIPNALATEALDGYGKIPTPPECTPTTSSAASPAWPPRSRVISILWAWPYLRCSPGSGHSAGPARFRSLLMHANAVRFSPLQPW